MKRLIGGAAVAGVFLCGWLLGQHFGASPAHAQIEKSVPRSYGPLKGSVGGFLIFEDSAGVIRIVDPGHGKVTIVVPRS